MLALIRTEFPGNLIRLLSNGRMFADEDFARRACGIAQLPFEVAVPMFGYDAKTHESISRAPHSFAQTTQGLRHLLKHRRPGQLVEIRVIMTRIQCRYLDGLLDFLLAEFPEVDRIVFLYEELEGFAEHYGAALKIPMSEAAAHLDRNIEKIKMFKSARLYHFALCTVPARLWPFVWNTLADFKVTYLEGCLTRCRYKAQCVGVHRSYVKHMGAPDIAPILSPRAVVLSGNPYQPISAVEESAVETQA